ncbi:TonB-dependent receptor domain-containing protein [Gloeobacter violaceus]|uniref:Glr0354 protein n=1 Tax=Gloeobacter violaceus (strain ATCC 29082 / PCC 7421) TaxID=251221 RepID=Q7NNQ6_GLOVI|nr:TonB-dependent receptor [Gloeobacter violaceus]BAC88295.1 glr0354 [Gloeobacter violaceus PCC 7421]
MPTCPIIRRSATGQLFRPVTGVQYEVGAKAELAGGRSLATAALYELTKQNALTTDPDNPLFSIQTGEVQSKGFEVDLSGRPLPGWDIYASYAYIDARYTRDNDIAVGTEVGGVPGTSLYRSVGGQTTSAGHCGWCMGRARCCDGAIVAVAPGAGWTR